MNIINTQNNSFTQPVSTMAGTSDNWNSTRTTVQTNSASWGGGGGTSLQTVLDHLSTNNVQLSSVVINQLPIKSDGRNLSRASSFIAGYKAMPAEVNNSSSTFANNFVFGLSAGENMLSCGVDNVFMGGGTAQRMTKSCNNVFLGSQAGRGSINFINESPNPTDFTLVGATQHNVAIGECAGRNLQQFACCQYSYYCGPIYTLYSRGACNNVFIGQRAGSSTTIAYQNVAIGGPSTFINNTTGLRNTAVGSAAGVQNTTGSSNVFLGYRSGYCNTTGSCNVFIGDNAGALSCNGTKNIYLGGTRAGFSGNSGCFNTVLGFGALVGCCKCFATALGDYSYAKCDRTVTIGRPGVFSSSKRHLRVYGCVYTSSGFFDSNGSVAGIARDNSYQNVSLVPTAGQVLNQGGFNVFGGCGTATVFSTGVCYRSHNTTLGHYAGQYICGTTLNNGAFNTFIGAFNGAFNRGSRNTFVGAYAGLSDPGASACANVAVGNRSGYCFTTGSGNILVGNNAGFCITTATCNTFLGFGAGCSTTTGSCNVFLGSCSRGNANNVACSIVAGVNSIGRTNSIVLGSNATAPADSVVVLGSTTSPLSTVATAGSVDSHLVVSVNGTLRRIALLSA